MASSLSSKPCPGVRRVADPSPTENADEYGGSFHTCTYADLEMEVRSQREQTVRLIDMIAGKQEADIAGIARRLEEGMRGMASRIGEVERAMDQLSGSVRETREVAARHDATLAKHREAVQRLYEELRLSREEHKEDRRQRQGERLRRELDLNVEAYHQRKQQQQQQQQQESGAIFRVQQQLEEMQKKIEGGVAGSKDDVRHAMKSLQRKVSSLDERLQSQGSRYTEEVQLLARSEEASSALHEQHRTEAMGINQRCDALEQAVKELGKHMQQRDRVGRDMHDMCDEHEQAIESIKHAIQIMSREIVQMQTDAG